MKHLKHKNIIAIIFFLVECFAFFLFAKEAHFRLGRYVWLLIILFFALNAWKLQKDLLSLGEKKEPEAKKRSPGHPQKRKGYYSNPSAGLEGEPVLSAVTETVMKTLPHERSDQMVKLVIDRSGGSDGAEPLQFEFVLTDETTRKRIGNFIKHKYWNSGYRGLNLVYGVTDEDNTIFLSRCHSAGSNADGGRSDDYIVLTDRRAFLAHWNYIYYCESDSTPVRVEQGYERYLDLVGQAVACYENYLKRRAFEEQCKNEHPGLDFKLTELVDQYRTQFENEIKEEKYRRLSECEKDNAVLDPPCCSSNIREIFDDWRHYFDNRYHYLNPREVYEKGLQEDFPQITREECLKLIRYFEEAVDYCERVGCSLAWIYQTPFIPSTYQSEKDVNRAVKACLKRYPWMNSEYIKHVFDYSVHMCNR